MSDKESTITKVGNFVFEIRWGLMPMYIGLWVAMLLYIVKFGQGIYELSSNFWTLNENDMLVAVLGLIDITMIGNLIVMTTIGGFSIFVKEYDTKMITDKPRWLNNINSSTLKIKMGMSLIGVGAIHLLKTFFDVGNIDWMNLSKLGFIFGLFILFTYMLCVIDEKLHSIHPSKAQDE
jgi:uncharacterized protein (TIGR00645 family)